MEVNSSFKKLKQGYRPKLRCFRQGKGLSFAEVTEIYICDSLH